MIIGILEPNSFSKEALKILNEIGDIEFLKDDNKLDMFLRDKDILFIRLSYYIGKDLLNKAEKLKYLCTPTTGLNHIDLLFAKEKGIKIISLKNEYDFLLNIRATPEHTIGLVLSLLRNYKSAFLNLKNQEWNRDKYWGFELFKNNVGIIGFGRVGKILAQYFNCFGAKVYFYDIDLDIKEKYNANKVKSIEDLIKKTNIIILCVSYNIRNDKFFNKKYIDLLKNKFFINISRGELIDEDYLVKRSEENYFRGLALDVITNETRENNNLNKFLHLTENKNIILTSHIGGATYESISKTEEFIAEKLKKGIFKK